MSLANIATFEPPYPKTMRPQVGQLINNKYRLLRLIGDGGMGSVYECQHEVLGTSVALKFLHPELCRRQAIVQRFLQEARVSAKIQSAHVVRVTDVEQMTNGMPFIVMEFLNGKSLQTTYEDLYKAGKRLSFEEALNYSLQMLDGLEAAHDEGIVHRDLKPDNVMIVKGKRTEPVVKILDFGIAKLRINGELYKGLTRPGVIMGTPEYMAPEQVFSADQVDARADIFSCGVMFFEMLAGRRPVGGDEPHQIAAQYLGGSVAKLSDLAPHVPAELAAVVHKAMAADPKDRYSSVVELQQAMAKFVPQRGSLSSIGASGASVVGASSRPPPAVEPSPSVTPHAAAAVSVSASPSFDGGATEKMSDPFPRVSGDSKIQGGTAVIMDASVVRDALTGRPSDSALTPAGVAISSPTHNPMMESTVEGSPFFPGATEGYAPLNYDARPGGTSVGAGLPGTASYDGRVGPTSAAPAPAYPAPAQHAAPARPKKGIGMLGIFIAATLVAGLAVGGVYVYNQGDSGSDRKEKDYKPITATTPKTVAIPQETAPTVATPIPQPTPTPTPTSTPNQTPTGKKPQPQTKPTGPTWVIPSQFPIPDFPPIVTPPFGLPGTDPGTTTPEPGRGRPKIGPQGNTELPGQRPSRGSTETTQPETTTPSKPDTTTPSKPDTTTPSKPDTTTPSGRRPINRRPSTSTTPSTTTSPSTSASTKPSEPTRVVRPVTGLRTKLR